MTDGTVDDLAIVGTAGRRDDLARLGKGAFLTMVGVAEGVCRSLSPSVVRSGGAPWAEHAAIRLALTGVIDPRTLVLHLAAPFEGGRFAGGSAAAGLLNELHGHFRRVGGIDGLGDIGRVIAAGAATTSSGGFRERDALLGASDAVLAFTFAGRPVGSMLVGGRGTPPSAVGVVRGSAARVLAAARPRVKAHVSMG